MNIQNKRPLNALSRKLFLIVFACCLALIAGTMGCSDSGGSSRSEYYLTGYDGVISDDDSSQGLAAAMGNQDLKFYAEFPWFVNITCQVTDHEERGVGDLTTKNFTVLEDGVEVEKARSEMNIRKRDDLPSGYSYGIKTVLFLDNTSIPAVPLENMLECGQVLVDYLDEKQQQEVAIMAYDETGEAEVVQDFTNDFADLNQVLTVDGGIEKSFGTTNFYGGVISALALWEDNHSPAKPDFQQGFLVTVTDGKDTSGLQNVDDAIARRGDKQIFVVAVGDDIPEDILKDLEDLGNAGFYHVTHPQAEPDEGWDGNENLCEHMMEVQNRITAYADGFYWLRYKTSVNSAGDPSTHTLDLTVSHANEQNTDPNAQITGTFESDVLFSGEPDIYFNTTASDPNGLYDEETGLTEKTIMLERGQRAGDVQEPLSAITYRQTGASPFRYEWESKNTDVVTVKADRQNTADAVINVVGPGTAVLVVTDMVNNITQELTVKVKIREEGFKMLGYAVTSQAPWFADATFQVCRTYDPADYDDNNPWQNRWEWVTDLAREDMTVVENGRPVDMEIQELHLQKRDNVPAAYTYTLKTVLHIDNSPSVSGNLELIKGAAKAFIKRALVNDPLDNTDLGPLLNVYDGSFQQEIAVISYSEAGDTILIQDFTTDFSTLIAAIDSIGRGYGPIDFYDSMVASLDLMETDHRPYDAGNGFVQGVLVVMSDGWQSNPGYYDREAVLAETGDKQIICVSVGDDLVSENSKDLVDFNTAGFYSVPDPATTVTKRVWNDGGTQSKTVNYTILQRTLMDIQHVVHAYANSFYWLQYKSALEPSPVCDRSESMVISIDNNNNQGPGKKVSGAFESCNFFEGMDGMIMVNPTVTNPAGLTGDIELKYVMLGNVPLDDPVYLLEAFTYDNDGDKNTPAYEWAISNQNIVQITPDPSSYANSRAELSLPAVKRTGSASLRIDDTGNSVWKNIYVNVDGLHLPAPIAFYPFDGNADDETGNGYDGEVFGATLTPDRNGNRNSAYSFNGSGDYIALNMFYGNDAGAVSDSVDNLTVCAWFKTANKNKNVRIVSFDYSNFWELYISSEGQIYFGSIPYGETNHVKTTQKFNDNEWHFIVATLNTAGEMKLYVDGDTETLSEGVLPDSGDGESRYGFIGVKSIANSYDGKKYPNTYFDGSIDDVIIFDVALSEGQIASLVEAIR